MVRNSRPVEAEEQYEVQKWLAERDSKLEAVGISAQYRERDNGRWVTPIVEISIITDRKLRRAANLMSPDHTTFTLEVIPRLKDFAGKGGRYSDQAAAVITALTEQTRTTPYGSWLMHGLSVSCRTALQTSQSMSTATNRATHG